jgi:hypothetical protein
MKFAFYALLASLLSELAVNSYYISDYIYSFDYIGYCTIRAFIYTFSAAFCIFLFKKSNSKLGGIIILSLIFCMIISSLFNLFFILPYFYDLMIEFKTSYWKVIYRSIEILTIITVGLNGIHHINNLARYALNKRNHDICGADICSGDVK